MRAQQVAYSAILTGLGSLVGALAGDGVLRSFAGPGTPTTTTFQGELGRHLAEMGEANSDILVALMWTPPGELRLTCRNPAGRQHEGTVSTAADGRLAHWHLAEGDAPEGTYQVLVGRTDSGSEPVPFVCGVKVGDAVQEFSSSIEAGAEPQIVYVFENQDRRAMEGTTAEVLRGATWGGLLAAGLALGLLLGPAGPLSSGKRGIAWLVGAAGLGLIVGAGVGWLGPQQGPNLQMIRLGVWPILGGLLAALALTGSWQLRPAGMVFGGVSAGALAAAGFGIGGPLLPAPWPGGLAAAVLGLGFGSAFALALASAGPEVKPGRPLGLSLWLPGNRVIPLADGQRLTVADLPGVPARLLRRTVARVNRKPDNPAVFGLTNLSRGSWSAVLDGKTRTTVPPGRSVRLVAGARIDFGPLSGEIR